MGDKKGWGGGGRGQRKGGEGRERKGWEGEDGGQLKGKADLPAREEVRTCKWRGASFGSISYRQPVRQERKIGHQGGRPRSRKGLGRDKKLSIYNYCLRRNRVTECRSGRRGSSGIRRCMLFVRLFWGGGKKQLRSRGPHYRRGGSDRAIELICADVTGNGRQKQSASPR